MCIQNPASDTAAMQAYLAAAQIDIAESDVVRFHTAVPDALFRSYLGSLKSVYTVTELQAMTTFSAGSRGLTDVTGIEYATLMTSLSVGTNKIESLPVAGLLSLAVLSAATNSLTDIQVLPLLNLTTLSIRSNLILQPELEGIIMDLWTNRVELGGNSCVISLQNNPGSAAAAVSMASEIADLVTAGCTVTI